MTRFFCATALLLATSGAASAAPLLSWNFTTAGGNAATDGNIASVAATTVAPAMLTAAITRGTANPAAALYNFADRGAMNAQNNWAVPTLASSVSGNRYFEFTAAPAAGGVMSIDSLDVALFQQNANASAAVDVLYSLDGFSTSANAGTFTSISDAWTGTVQTLNLTGVPALQNVSAPVTFRLYGYGFGSFEDQGLGQIGGSNADVTLNGTVSVPEPASLAALGLGLLSLLARRRRA